MLKKKGALLTIIFFVLVTNILLGGCSSSNTDPSSAQPIELHMMTAASLTEAMNELKDMYEAEHGGIEIIPNFGSSGQLKAQIDQGAPADIFLSAAVHWMDELEEAGNIQERNDLLRNELALIIGAESDISLQSFDDLLKDEVLGFSIGQPDTVPAGAYSQQLLENLNIYDELDLKITFGSDVRHVLTYVETGNVDAGIVYHTDAIISDKIEIVALADPNDYDEVIYPIGLLESADHPDEAKDFYDWLQTREAINIFEKYGFKGM